MAGNFLIDLTDASLQIAPNADVIGFVRRANPSAHSDVGSVLLELGKATPGAHPYCPSYASFAYVVLHTEAKRIFAIAFGQRGLAFRLAPPAMAAAFADGGVAAPEIGPDWVSYAPWAAPATAAHRARRQRWCARALADAVAASG